MKRKKNREYEMKANVIKWCDCIYNLKWRVSGDFSDFDILYDFFHQYIENLSNLISTLEK